MNISIRTWVLIGIGLLTVTIGFALLTTQLDILGRATVTGSGWSIYFDNLEEVELVGQTEEEQAPTISTNNTVLSGFELLFKTGGDSASYIFGSK